MKPTTSKTEDALQNVLFRAAEFERGETGTPVSLNEETRSVNVVAATEQPVVVWDWERWEPVREVLLMSGCQLPVNRQMPFLGEHFRFNQSLENVIGSCRELEVRGGALIGRAQFSACEEAEKPYTKVREGHVTDVSIGYRVTKAIRIGKDESQIVDGKTFRGPLRVATEWAPIELTLCPIGADQASKIRAAIISADAETPIEKPVEAGAQAPEIESRTGGSNEMDEKELQTRVDEALARQTEASRAAMKKVFDRAAAAGQEGLAFRMYVEGKTEDEITDAIIAAQAKERGTGSDAGEGEGADKRTLDKIDDETLIRGLTSPDLMVLE